MVPQIRLLPIILSVYKFTYLVAYLIIQFAAGLLRQSRSSHSLEPFAIQSGPKLRSVVPCIISFTYRHCWRFGVCKTVELRPSARLSVRLSVQCPFCPIIWLPHVTAASLLLWARQPGNIDRLLHGRRSAANASSVPLPCTDVES